MKSNPLKASIYFLAVFFLIPTIMIPLNGQDKPQSQERDRYQTAIEQKAKMYSEEPGASKTSRPVIREKTIMDDMQTRISGREAREKTLLLNEN